MQCVMIIMYSGWATSCGTHSPVGCQMALQRVDNNVDLSCAGFPDAAPSGILACPLAGVSLQELHSSAEHTNSHHVKMLCLWQGVVPLSTNQVTVVIRRDQHERVGVYGASRLPMSMTKLTSQICQCSVPIRRLLHQCLPSTRSTL